MRFSGIVLILTLAACAGPADPPGWQRVIGWANPEMSSIQAIKFPAEVVANQAFDVTITTIGSSSCTRADGATATVDQNIATVTPYDFIAPPNTACTRDLRTFARTVSVKFPAAGPATIRLNTRAPDGKNTTYDWTIQVRPG
jgi:hypothetical protein